MVPFWVPNTTRHLIFKVPQKGDIILTTTHIRATIRVQGLESFGTLGLGF